MYPEVRPQIKNLIEKIGADLLLYKLAPSQFGAASRVVALEKPHHMHGRRQLEDETEGELQLPSTIYNSVNNEH